MPFDSSSTFSLTAGAETSFMADGIVIYQVSREKVHYLNPTAAIVYRLCGESASVEQIIDYLRRTFSLQEPPRIEVHQCIEQFLAEELIVPC
jgi:hypothetical protein